MAAKIIFQFKIVFCALLLSFCACNEINKEEQLIKSRAILKQRAAKGPQDIVRCALQDKKGNIWFGTWEGIFKYDGHAFTNFTVENKLSNHHVFSIIQDKDENIWFASMGGGVLRYNSTTNNITHFTTKDGLASNSVYSAIQDKAGNIWFGTWDAGISCYNAKNNADKKFKNFSIKDGLSENRICWISEDKRGDIWFATWNSGLCRYTPTEKSNKNLFTHFTTANGLCSNDVRNILEDKNGKLWFGTMGGGACCYNPLANSRKGEKEFIWLSQFNNGLCQDDVGSILEDKNGALYFGACNGCVASFNLSTNDTAKYAKALTTLNLIDRAGIKFNCVFDMLEDKEGKIWFCTAIGVCYYNPAAQITSGDNSITSFLGESGC